MKISLYIFFVFYYISVNGQNINGTYKSYTKGSSKSFEVKIIDDSIYELYGIENTLGRTIEKFVSRGKITKVDNRNYYYIDYDTVTKKPVNIPIKITKRKMIFYNPKPGKQIKVIELSKAGI